MEVIGGGSVHVYEPKDLGSHAPGPDPIWQESVVLLWWDLKQSIGGFYRIGHELKWPDGPKIALWSCTFTPEGTFKKTTYLPLRREDQSPTSFGSGDGTHRYDFDGDCVWTIADENISAKLRVHDFHASIDCYPKHGAISEFAPHHMEVAGSVTGTLTVKGKTYNVDALGFRDQGWGNRAWDTLLSHRWLAGVVSKDFSFCLLAWHTVDDSMAKFGWVVRGDTVTYTKELDIVAYVEPDALCIRGGHAHIVLTTGEVFDLEFEALAPCAVSYHHEIACVDTLTRVTCGDMVGIANFETTANHMQGKRRPKNLSRGIIENGWHAGT
jgi:hypothetical protein